MILRPSQRRPLVILVVTCVALAVLAVALVRRGSWSTSEGAGIASRRIGAGRLPFGRVRSGLLWQIGDQRTYDVKLRSTVHLAVTGGEAKNPVDEIGVNVEGSWWTMVVSSVEG